MSAAATKSRRPVERREHAAPAELPSWVVGLCGVAAVASLLFTVLLFLNR
jgi:hypothetical protein